MPNKIGEEVRRLILDDLILIGSVSGSQYVAEFTKRVVPDVADGTLADIARHMDSFKDWDFWYLFNDILELTHVPDEKFIYFCEQYVHPIMNRSFFDEENEERVDVTKKCIIAINKRLSELGLMLRATNETNGISIYKVVPTTQSVSEPIKNIIFAAKYKPDIVIDDALSNSIMVANANGALVYDQGIPADGIRWNTLAQWYSSLENDNNEKKMAHYFYDCLDSDAEKLFYKGYIEYIKKNGKHLPALIPQVYLYYDPKKKTEREIKVFEHQKMDFMMVISTNQRIVIEIDGIQHYAEDSTAPGTQFKRYASAQRYAEMMKAHREMVLVGYDVYRFGGRELWVNDANTEESILDMVSGFFDALFEKYGVELKK